MRAGISGLSRTSIRPCSRQIRAANCLQVVDYVIDLPLHYTYTHCIIPHFLINTT